MVVQQQKQGRPENIWKNPARAEETMRGSEAGRLRGTLSIEISKGVERTHSYKIPETADTGSIARRWRTSQTHRTERIL